MTAPKTSTSGPTGTQSPVGNRAREAPQVDLDQLTQKVYELMMEELRLELARREGRVR